MLRRLATIAAALTLAACSDGYNLPTGVVGQQNIEDSTTLPPDFCVDYVADEESTLIPPCIDYLPWPVDAVENRARHGFEAVTNDVGRKGTRF